VSRVGLELAVPAGSPVATREDSCNRVYRTKLKLKRDAAETPPGGSLLESIIGHLNRKKSESDLRQIDRLIELADKALAAQASELKALEEELNGIIAWFVKGQASTAADSTAFSVAIAHAHRKTTRGAPARADRLHASTPTVNGFCLFIQPRLAESLILRSAPANLWPHRETNCDVQLIFWWEPFSVLHRAIGTKSFLEASGP
jgi:hypothetical protein